MENDVCDVDSHVRHLAALSLAQSVPHVVVAERQDAGLGEAPTQLVVPAEMLAKAVAQKDQALRRNVNAK